MTPPTKPPAPIELAFSPQGKLWQYRLRWPVGFRCSRCQRDMRARLLATVDEDWNRVLCARCYALSVNEAKRKQARMVRPPKKEQAKRGRKGETKQSLAAKRAKQKRDSPMSMKERRQLSARLPGLGQLLRFFRASGIPAERLKGGRLAINGRVTQPLEQVLPRRERAVEDKINYVALRYCGDVFAAAIAEHGRFGEGLRAFLRWREGGFVVMRGEVALATILATEASVPQHGAVEGSFLVGGPHWQRLADLVHESEPALVAEHERKAAESAAKADRATRHAAPLGPSRESQVPMRRLEHFPATTDDDLVEACLEASRQIRAERQVAYDRAVVLESAHGELSLLPIAGSGTRLRVPFRLHRASGVVKGALLVGEPTDPLPAVIEARVTEDDAVCVWACALLGFTAATCFEPEPVDLRVSTRPSQSRTRATTHVPGRRGRRGGPQPRTVPRRRSWPTHLEPIGEWTRYRGSFVAGHRRRLSDDRSASAEARERARDVGITLNPGETWVQPHTRGIPEHFEMRFRWHSPDALGS